MKSDKDVERYLDIRILSSALHLWISLSVILTDTELNQCKLAFYEVYLESDCS